MEEKKPIFDNIKWGELVPNLLANGGINAYVMTLPIEERYKYIILLVYNAISFFYGFMRNPKKLDWDYAANSLDNAARLAGYQRRKRSEAAESSTKRDRGDEI